MTRLFKTLFITLLSCMWWGCSGSDDGKDEPAAGDGYARFIQSSVSLSSGASESTVRLEWKNTSWEIIADETEDRIILSVTPSSGGGNSVERKYETIKITYGANETKKDRTQKLKLIDKATGEASILVIVQSPRYKATVLTVDRDVKYQPVAGFGGMYNPVIWCGSNVLSSSEMAKLYDADKLGYSILRLMVYPNEKDWEADVQGALYAQQQGALIFASPWDCTDALADKVKVGDKEMKHLKKENYAAYANHLVKYIQFMKSKGVNIYALSVQNEPDMEFTYWTPAEIVSFVKEFGSKIRETGVKLMSPEACGTQPEYTDAVINDANAMANTDIVAGHLYQGFIDLDKGWDKARHDYVVGIYNRLGGKTWWMTEHLFNDGENESDTSKWQFVKWDYALDHLGKELHMCMDGNCSAYIYWYIKRFYGLMGDNDKRSPVAEGEITKNGYIMSHYAKYATGTTRVKAVSPDANILVTAYAVGNEVRVVILNMSSGEKLINIPAAGAKTATAICTSETSDMATLSCDIEDGGTVSFMSGARSIISIRIAF